MPRTDENQVAVVSEKRQGYRWAVGRTWAGAWAWGGGTRARRELARCEGWIYSSGCSTCGRIRASRRGRSKMEERLLGRIASRGPDTCAASGHAAGHADAL